MVWYKDLGNYLKSSWQYVNHPAKLLAGAGEAVVVGGAINWINQAVELPGFVVNPIFTNPDSNLEGLANLGVTGLSTLVAVPVALDVCRKIADYLREKHKAITW